MIKVYATAVIISLSRPFLVKLSLEFIASFEINRPASDSGQPLGDVVGSVCICLFPLTLALCVIWAH